MTQKTHLVLFDGECSFCRRSIEWAASRDKSRTLRFQAYQQADIPEQLRRECTNAVHVITGEGVVLRAEQASLFILERCGWGHIARLLRFPPFSWAAAGVYFVISRNRELFHRLLFRSDE